MPNYELALILKAALQRPEVAQTLRRTCEAIMQRGGVVRKMENLGPRMLPYRMTRHGQRHLYGSYFLVQFSGQSSQVEDLQEQLDRDVDIVRPSILQEEAPWVPPCQSGPCQWGELPTPSHERQVWRQKTLKKLHSTRRDKGKFRPVPGSTFGPLPGGGMQGGLGGPGGQQAT